ncbi:hypothetical protein K2173_021963 [Erythroxylum novogranatense]|uniref:Ribosomal protein L34Ae n=1 Tax=Erythroxylum novogranatense TaxID=1862640 RepID=A0AAV8T3T2_9ROSI|nr:hypothetical protein K2173_021963 [Erythroxylum novogranatense]
MKKSRRLIQLMDTGKVFATETPFDLVNRNFVYGNVQRVVSCFWVLVCNIFYVFGWFFRLVFRNQSNKRSDKNDFSSGMVCHRKDTHQTGSSSYHDSGIDKSEGKTEDTLVVETASSASSNKYEFLSGKGISGFIEEVKTVSFSIHEVDVNSNDDTKQDPSVIEMYCSTSEDMEELELEKEASVEFEKSFVVEKLLEPEVEEGFIEEGSREEKEIVVDHKTPVEAYEERELKAEVFDAEKVENGVKSWVIEKVCGAQKTEDCSKNLIAEDVCEKEEELEIVTDERRYNMEEIVGLMNKLGDHHSSSDESQLPYDEKQVSLYADSESSGGNTKVDSFTYKFFAYGNASKGLVSGDQSPVKIHEHKLEYDGDTETEDKFTDSDEEYIELEPQRQKSSSSFEEAQFEDQEAAGSGKAEPETKRLETPEVPSLQEKERNSSNVHDSADFSLEHDDLIEQLKMELRNARKVGLPTILEESEMEELESPKLMPELKPLKIEEKIDHMEEIQKVYKGYLDKMKKLDILNFQIMHTTGLFQLKDAIQSYTVRKFSIPATTSGILQNLWSCKSGTAVVDPSKKVVADMYREFEMVYVGQICLSWEILLWQYCKVQEMQIHEFQGLHRYNQVAGEFQLFQVLVQRFIENEPFQGPRVQNYVKNRCVLRSLLQIPVIKDDNSSGWGERGEEEYAITSETLIKIIEESIRVFWEFLHANKDESNMALHGRQYFQDDVNSELLMEVQVNLQKKERKLKDLLRIGNCIVRKFQKHQQDPLHQSLLVARVNLKLVSRVLNMSKLTTDQLIWCHEKLERVNFRNRKAFVEQSCLLFPC